MTRPLLLVLPLFLLLGCRQQSTHRDWAAMDCNFAATLHGSGAIPPEAALDSLQALSREYEALFTDYDPTGPLSILRGRAGDTVRPDPRIVEVLRGALPVMAASHGALDIGLHDLKALWKLDAAEPNVPDSASIAKVLERRFGPALANLYDAPVELLPDGRVVLHVDSLPIDLGGVAKGWAVDRMSEALVRLGYPTHLIQGGGEIITRGTKSRGSWMIGIKNPRATSTTAALVELDTGMAISTSGDYERFFLKDGVRYHHLFVPATGRPSRNGTLSATLLCPTSSLCDLWSKPMFLLGPEHGKRLADSLGIPVLWVRETPSGLCGSATESWGKRLVRDTLSGCP
jgi:thiamine biosynthesis lipoprotein